MIKDMIMIIIIIIITFLCMLLYVFYEHKFAFDICYNKEISYKRYQIADIRFRLK